MKAPKKLPMRYDFDEDPVCQEAAFHTRQPERLALLKAAVDFEAMLSNKHTPRVWFDDGVPRDV